MTKKIQVVERKRIPAEERRRMILRSAIQVFSESNYRVANVNEIAKLSGVTEPMVYRHFQSKKSLFLEVLKLLGTKSIERISVPIGQSSNSITDIENVTKTYLNSINKYKKETKIFYQAISEMDDEEIKSTLQNVYKSYADLYHSLVNQGKKEGKISEDFNGNRWGWDMVGILLHVSAFYLLELYNENSGEQIIKQHFLQLK